MVTAGRRLTRLALTHGPHGLYSLRNCAGCTRHCNCSFRCLKKRNDFSKPCHDPQKLFRELSQAHKLDRGGQRLLRELADAFQLDQPADIFLQPALFEARQIPQHLQAEQERLAELYQRLF